jgi:hypothetical protein
MLRMAFLTLHAVLRLFLLLPSRNECLIRGLVAWFFRTPSILNKNLYSCDPCSSPTVPYRLFSWFLVRLKPTTGNKYLVTAFFLLQKYLVTAENSIYYAWASLISVLKMQHHWKQYNTAFRPWRALTMYCLFK